MALFFATFGACFIGYVLAGFGTNIYTVGYRSGFVQPSDYSLTVMQGVGKNDKKKYLLQHTQLMHEVLIQKKGKIEVLDWLILAKHYAKNGEEEIAFQCYYMAHLLDRKVGTNSGLKFGTLDNPNIK